MPLKTLNFLHAELQHKKILEELQVKKQMLLKQGVAPTLNSSLGVLSTGSASSIVSKFQFNHSIQLGAFFLFYFILLIRSFLNSRQRNLMTV